MVNDHALQQPDSNGDHVLTSEHGQDVVMAGAVLQMPPSRQPAPSETEPDEEPAELALPPPLPLPAASSIVAGGGAFSIRKNAINEGLAGTVKVEAYVPKGSTSANRIEIIQSSGASSLDQVARLTIQNGGEWSRCWRIIF